MRLKIQTCICSPNLVILLPGKYDCSEQSGSQSFGSAIVSSTDTCLQKSKPNPTFQGTPVCHSAIRERLLQLGDTMKAAGGWHLEDRFQSWVHKQPWRQMLPLDGFECFACMNPKQIYLNVWFLPSQFRGIYIYTADRGSTCPSCGQLESERFRSLSCYPMKFWQVCTTAATSIGLVPERYLAYKRFVGTVLRFSSNSWSTRLHSKELKFFWGRNKDLAADIRQEWDKAPWLHGQTVQQQMDWNVGIHHSFVCDLLHAEFDDTRTIPLRIYGDGAESTGKGSVSNRAVSSR